MESRERCFLPMLLYIGTGPAGLEGCGGGGTPLLSGKAGAWRKCCTLIVCQNTHRSEKRQLGRKERGPKGARRGPKSNPCPFNSHTNSAQAHRTPPQMKLTAKTKLRTRPVSHFKAFDQQFLRTKHSERLIKSVRLDKNKNLQVFSEVRVNSPVCWVKCSVINEQSQTGSCVWRVGGGILSKSAVFTLWLLPSLREILEYVHLQYF